MTLATEPRSSAGAEGGLLSLVDFCKGVAIVWTVSYHAALAKLPWFGWQSVHLFVVMSGFLLAYSCLKKDRRGPWRGWFVRRMHRIFPSYWLVCFIGFGIVVLLEQLGANSSISPQQALVNLGLQLPMLHNFTYVTMMAPPNAALWFVPLIFGFYLVFPALFRILRACGTGRALVLFLLGSFALEFIYRAVAIRFLDGVPVGFGAALLGERIGSIPEGLDLVRPRFPFQGIAPFGLFLSRLSAFVLGMVAAALLIRHRERVEKILSGWAALVGGLAVWIAGNAMIYLGGVFWVLADAVIAVGVITVVVGIAYRVVRLLPAVFRLFDRAGKRSLEIFLVHLPVMHVYAMLYPRWADSALLTVVMFGAVIAAIGLATYLLMRFEDSKAPNWFMRQTIDRVFGSPAA